MQFFKFKNVLSIMNSYMLYIKEPRLLHKIQVKNQPDSADITMCVSVPTSYLFVSLVKTRHGQDGRVFIWTCDDPAGNTWTAKLLHKFNDVVWHVSWSITGNILAVSGGDNKRGNVWKQSLSESVCEGVYVCVSVRIRERQLSSVPVQIHSDPLELLLQLCRKEMSSALSSSSVALTVCERAAISLLTASIFSSIILLFCSSSSLSAAILASSSSSRNW
ncbi:hypothetical protein F7725_016450 [Dissostichus mawsoni]|uniref:Protein SEC13 homolog n=1 Tax=Dissostichus mawsoni TaxID=36200 RepID=A0A7J5Z4K3_DISMA|nr:hypothetical protein F7725_016450 [Dissostichus mawsoni]